jgi:multiple sugar transport system substrate-binding protein
VPERNLPIGRRAMLRSAGLAALAGAGLTGCGSAFASGVAGAGTSRQTLTYWTLLGGGDGGRMVTMEQAYQKSHPEVDLQATTLAWGNPYYTKLSLATLGDQPPDVGIAHLTRATILAQAGLLEPLNLDELAGFGMTADNFRPTAWRKAHTNGTLYAIPLDTHPFVMYYNTDVCKKAGLLDADGQLKNIDGPDGLTGALTAAQKASGQYGGVMSIGGGDYATNWRIFSTLYYQLGGSMLADDGTRVVMDDDKATKVLTYLANLTKGGLLPGNTDYGSATTAFATGKAGFFFQGDWEITTFQTSKTPFSMTRFPNVFGGRYAVQADSHSFVLPKNAKRDATRRAMTLTFVKALLDQSPTWVLGGHIPAWLPYADSPAYRKVVPQYGYAGVADYARYDDPGWYSGSGSDFETVTGSAISAVFAGQMAPDAAVRQMRSRLTKYAKTASPV